MRVPQIRYPLFWLAGGLLLAGAWKVAWPLTAGWRGDLQRRWTRAVEGPPVPRSDTPQVLAGPMTRRVLLLRDNLPATDRPGGRTIETIARRRITDVFDVWPLAGEPTHYRVGTRQPFGWVPADAVLPWPTRLVVTDHGPPAPVVGANASGLQVVRWTDNNAWTRPGRRERIATDAPGLGVLLSRDELAILLRRAVAGESAEELRLRAILGRLADRTVWTPEDRAAVRSVLPPVAVERRAAPGDDPLTRLATILREDPPVAGWGGLDLLFIPLDALP